MREIDEKLIEAIKKNKSLREIKKLIKNGANVNAQDEYGRTPIFYTSNYKKWNLDLVTKFYKSYNIRLLDLLLENGANINIQDNKGNTLAFYVIHYFFKFKNKSISKITQIFLFIGRRKLKNSKFKYIKKLLEFYGKINIFLINFGDRNLSRTDKIEIKFFRNIIKILIELPIVIMISPPFLLFYILISLIYIPHIEDLYENYFFKIIKISNLCLKNKKHFNSIEYLLFYYLENKQNEYKKIIDKNKHCIEIDKVIELLIEFNKLNLSSMEFLLKNFKFNINGKIDNKTFLEVLLKKGNVEMVKFLIKKGVNVNIVLSNGKNLLETIEILGNQELINLIKSSPTYQPLDHNPKRLVEILTNFRKDTPIKYTTHLWDFDFKKDYGNFENYIKSVKNQWDEIEKELKELSPNIHKKINLFLFAKNEKEPWSSVEGDKLALGWSNLKGLKEWCNSGNNPFDFELEKNYKVEEKTINKFSDIINVFKREIQIRNENNHLEEIISDFEEQIYEKDDNFELEYEKLKGKTFYADVETFKKVLNRIFSEMLKRKNHSKIIIESKNDNEEYFDLTITQIASFSNLSAEEMIQKVKGGDFADIKNNLKNLCDWSIENRDSNGKNYRVNYLISKPLERIEYIDEKIEGFTHILRFYK